jgi:hypothetical protein
MATKKGPLPVRNELIFAWKDEDGEVKTYRKLLKTPRGRWAMQALPKILGFTKVLADIQSSLAGLGEGDIGGQLTLVEKFFTPENIDLFPTILQLETDEERDLIETKLKPIDVLNAVSEAVQFFISESFDRTDVQTALKKSVGEGAKEAQS